ncbi:MAG: hypothetical protein ABL890_03845 [Candidatus Peribacteraceae bacterium]
MPPIILGTPDASQPISLQVGDLEVAAFSNLGIGYEGGGNQDRVLIIPEKRIFMISDGVGSANGERGSIIAVDAIIDRTRGEEILLMSELLDSANTRITKADRYKGTQACVTIAQIEGNGEIEGAFSGDVEIGVTIDNDYMQNAPHQHPSNDCIVTSCLGSTNYYPETIHAHLESGKSLFIGSDGVTRNIPFKDIAKRLHSSNESPIEIVQWIFEESLRKMKITMGERERRVPRENRTGKCDNFSAILARRA